MDQASLGDNFGYILKLSVFSQFYLNVTFFSGITEGLPICMLRGQPWQICCQASERYQYP
jgi:hypothetical protein